MGGAEGGGVALQASRLQGFDTLVLHQVYAGMVLVVTHNFAKVKLRVRFSLPAPSRCISNVMAAP